MGGIKRKEAPSGVAKSEKKQKIAGFKPVKSNDAPRKSPRRIRIEKREAAAVAAAGHETGEDGGVPLPVSTKSQPIEKENSRLAADAGSKQFKVETTSAEAHAKQRQLAKERKAAKPNADAIQRSKQLWERLRRKSHVPKDERKKLVAELFSIIDGRVREFVFKHDSVRVIQCAIKYAKPEQLKKIVQELQNDVRELSESKYGKHLVAKMVVEGDREDKDMVIPQFYGHVKKLINHPEASWIVDDIYRQVATLQQKAMMLREWYGTEFALFGKQRPNASAEQTTADLRAILEESPEKRKPIMSYLKTMINNLIQKKMTAFTMLHDAMLQYFLALEPGSEDHSEFLEILKGDIDAEEEGGGGDLFRNLAFTQDGSRLVCLVLAYGSAKDRKVILKCFKDHIETMALDSHAKMVLVTGLDVPDDTKMTSQSILRDLLGLQLENQTERFDRLEGMITNLNARVPILYPMAGAQKWLVKDTEKALIEEIHKIRATTSKKTPEARRQELLTHMSAPLLEFVAERAGNLIQASSFASQSVAEILLECHDKASTHRSAAKQAVAQLAAGNPLDEGHMAKDPAASRMLKALVAGGQFDPATKRVRLVEPKLGFGDTLYPVIKTHVVEWACSDSSFVVVALLESEDVAEEVKLEVRAALVKGKKKIQSAADGEAQPAKKGEKDYGSVGAGDDEGSDGTKNKKNKKKAVEGKPKGNSGARILLGRI